MGRFAERITAATVDSQGITKLGAPASWLVRLLRGGPTPSGTDVTPNTAMSLTVVWRCIQLLSWLKAYLPLKVMRALPEGGADVDRGHPNYRLLAQRPNQWQTSFQRRQYATQCLLTRGESIEVIERGPDGEILSLIPQHNGRV